MVKSSSVYQLDDHSTVYQTVGIPDSHAEILEARKLYNEQNVKSLILVYDTCQDGTLRVIRLSSLTTDYFLESTGYQQICVDLCRQMKGRIVDRDIFTAAMYRMFVENKAPTHKRFSRIPKTNMHKSCFDLIFAFTPSTYCIVATCVKALDQATLQLHYCKFSRPVADPAPLF